MKIGMLTNAYKPYISGVTNHIALSKKFLELAGHEVYVFTFGDEDYKDDEPNIIRSPGLPLVDTGFYISLRLSSAARKLLYTMDLVHVHHPFQSGNLALRYCKPRGIPVVFTNHTRYDLYAQAYLPFLPDAISETALRAYLPAFCRACDLIISPSKGLQQVLVHLGVDAPIEVIPNGVDLTPFQQTHEPINAAKLGIPKDHVILMYVGRLGPEKNLPFLIRAFGGLAQALEKVSLVLVGEGPEHDNLLDQAFHAGLDHRIRFTGFVPYNELPSYLAMADAFVTASVTEVHPLSVIEALASGLPVLGIASPGVEDTVKDGETGYLTTHDLAAFTAKMVLLVTDHEARKRMSEKARQSAQDYDIRHITQILLRHYDRLYQASRQARQGVSKRLIRMLDRWS